MIIHGQTASIHYAGLGDKAPALARLGKARDERFNWIPFIQVDPLFDNLRSDPKFAALVQIVKARVKDESHNIFAP